MSKYLDYEGLKQFADLISDTYVSKDELNKLIQTKTFAEWLVLNNTVPEAGMILVYKDRTTVDGVPVPDIKLADGVTTVKNLPFLSTGSVETLVATYVKIIDDNESELSVLGAEEDSQTVKRDNLVKVKGNTVTATKFDGTATKVEHLLKIGNYEYDGSTAITIPIYGGE